MNNDNIRYLNIPLPEDIAKLKYNGSFKNALILIDNFLDKEIPMILRKRLELEKELIPILKKQYPYSFEEAEKMMKEKTKDFKKTELEKLKEESAADWILIDGKVYFQDRFFQTLVKTRQDIQERLFEKEKESIESDELLNNMMKSIKEKGNLSYYIHLKTGIKIKDEYIENGKTIKVHLPIPANAEQIKNINLINYSHIPKEISADSHPQRTVYFEEKISNDNNIFTVEYSYENHMKYIELNPDNVSLIQPQINLEEQSPHIVFTPYIKSLCEEILQGEKNPLLKARKIYDFITTKINYTFMREYITIENIPEYAALNLKGDCGVQALLFITLCRCTGIPAKWQSGMYVTPLTIGNHDWAQFYIAPYGWLYADCSFGGSAYRKGNKERWNFYFGNMDPFRMVANSEFQFDFSPNKNFLRIDPYDNQRGECEYDNKGLTVDEFEVIRERIEMKEI